MNNDFYDATKTGTPGEQPEANAAPGTSGTYNAQATPGTDGTYNAQAAPHAENAYGAQPDPNQPPFDGAPVQQPDPKGQSAQTMGIIALVGLFFCQIVSIVCGFLAMNNAKASFQMLGYESGPAKTGKICGMIGLILGALSVVISLLYAVLMIVLMVLGTL